MISDRFTVLTDANVLAPALIRNMLLSLAQAGLFRPRWSSKVLDETENTIAKFLKGDHEAARRSRKAIEKAFPEALVSDYEQLVDGVNLPDPDDRHILAAAVQTRTAAIVTSNLKDFPEGVLKPFQIDAMLPDDFLSDVIDLYPQEAAAALKRMRLRLNKPDYSADDFILRAEKVGLPGTAALLADLRQSL